MQSHRLSLLVFLTLFVLVAREGWCADRPHIVVILSDDAGYADFGFSGGRVVPTPHIDAIAAGGARLTQFYTTASVCSPSRAGFLTGRYQQRFGHHSNLTNDASRRGLGLDPGELTIADHLGARGYRTALVGKWHLGRAEELVPTSRGFDVFAGLVAGSRSYFAIDEVDPVHTMLLAERRADGTVEAAYLDEPALERGADERFYVTEWMGDTAARVIREHAARHPGEERPLFLFVSFTAPHTPMHALEDDLDAMKTIAPDLRQTYAAMMRSLDRAVGKITGALSDAEIADDTLVMFFNDNGGATNNGSDNGRYRGMKGSKWEGGIRVPAAVRWPGRIEPGMDFTPIVSSMDFAATAVAAAGGAIEGAPPLDGRDLMPHLRSGGPWADTVVHEALYWERGPAAAVRAGPWKLIVTEPGEPLLFHIPADPSETTDLAEAYPDRVRSLLTRLENWRCGMIAPLWTEGERWERNQLEKHRMEVLGRDAERRFP